MSHTRTRTPSAARSGQTRRSRTILLVPLALSLLLQPFYPLSAGAEASGTRATLTWDSSADVDLHVWDAEGHHAFAGAPSAIPGARLSGEETNGFGPELFTQSSADGRALTFGVCYDAGDQVTNTTLNIDDPDARPRSFATELDGPGHGEIVTQGPDGASSYEPPADFCGPVREPRSVEISRGCDVDRAVGYATWGAQRRIKVTAVATGCYERHDYPDGTSCAHITDFDTWYTGEGVKSSIVKLKPVTTLQKWRKLDKRSHRQASHCKGALGDGVKVISDAHSGKYSIVRNDRRDAIATPAINVRVCACAGEDTVGIRKRGDWTFN